LTFLPIFIHWWKLCFDNFPLNALTIAPLSCLFIRLVNSLNFVLLKPIFIQMFQFFPPVEHDFKSDLITLVLEWIVTQNDLGILFQAGISFLKILTLSENVRKKHKITKEQVQPILNIIRSFILKSDQLKRAFVEYVNSDIYRKSLLEGIFIWMKSLVFLKVDCPSILFSFHIISPIFIIDWVS
jgi:hypothetical protein